MLQNTKFRRFLRQPLSVLSVIFVLLGAFLYVRGEFAKSSQSVNFASNQAAMREAMDVFQDGQTSGGNQLASPDVKRIIGLLEAPSIGLSVMMVDYLSYSDLETAAARMTNSAPFGISGQTVVTGHRTGFGQPFFDLDRLKVGATISVTLKDTSVLNYIVRDQKIVSPDANLSEFDQSNSPSQLVLVTCDPKYSTDFRLLVIAELSGDATEPA